MENTPEILRGYGLDLAQRTCAQPWNYSQEMLSQVSRTFALNIQVLPIALKRPVLLSYLFCRMADTLEDDPQFTGTEKEAHLNRFRQIFLADDWRGACDEFVKELPKSWGSEENLDQFLTYYPEWPLALFFDLGERQVEVSSRWIDEMCQGMTKYSLLREQQNGWLRLQSVKELDEYCYYVAGTVGYMLTDLFANHSSLVGANAYGKMKELCNSFGLALQYTNIIKDIHEDYHRQTRYVPEELLQGAGVSDEDFLKPEFVDQGYHMVRAMSKEALHHLQDALDYTLSLPKLEPRMRLFCLWPLFLATGTLVRVLEGKTVLTADKVKITRPEVKSILRSTTWRCLSNGALRKLFEEDKKRIEQFIGA